MKFVDFFAGIGGIRLGLEQAGHECVGFCEFDKYARTAYKAMYDTEGEWENHDVRTVKPYDVPDADLWCFGFPCQDISVAGKQKGLQEGERSGLFYEIMRLLAGRKKEDRPRWLLVENVKNLLSIGNGFDFARLLIEVGGYGYSIQWSLLNSKDFGVPQNRERVFIVGYLGNISGREVFPLRPADGENPCELNEITQGVADAQRIYDGSGLARTLKGESGGQGGKTGLYAVKVGGLVDLSYKEFKQTEIARCLKARYTAAPTNHACEDSGVLTAQDRHGVAIYQRPRGYNKGGMHDIAPALSINAWQENNLLADNVRIRRLTPRECWRLQGFPDEYFDKAKAAGISDTQLYKQAGNGVTVNVARAIGERLKEIEENE